MSGKPPVRTVRKNPGLRVQKKCCCTWWTWTNTMQIFVFVLLVLALVVIALGVVYKSEATSLQRFCIEATAERVVGSLGEVGAEPMFGEFTLDTAENEIHYKFRYDTGTLSAIQAIHIRGPIQVGSQIGNLKFAVCGSPSTMVCDIITTPGQVEGSFKQVFPGGTDVRPEILNIRKEPYLYYLEILTSNHPATPGALRAPLNFICGTP